MNSRNVRIPTELWAALKTKAENQGTTASAIIRQLIIEWIRKK